MTACFSAEPQAVWLTEADADRKMKLLQLFTFTDPSGTVWDVPGMTSRSYSDERMPRWVSSRESM